MAGEPAAFSRVAIDARIPVDEIYRDPLAP